MDQNPTAPVLDPARCISLALPPTPMLQAPPHPDAYRPWVNLGQAVSQPPTQSLAPSHSANPLSVLNHSASQGQSVPSGAGLSAHRSKAAPSSGEQAPSHERQRPSQHLQTRFSSKSAAQQGACVGLNPTSPAALRFYLLAELTQTESAASWQCYLLTCSCTFRGVLQKVWSLTHFSPTHPPTLPPTHPPTYPRTHSLTHLATHPPTYPPCFPPSSVCTHLMCSCNGWACASHDLLKHCMTVVA